MNQEYRKNKSLLLKKEVLTHYGNGVLKCVQCGFNDIRALSIDHINGDGAKFRRENRTKSTYPWLKKNNYPKGHQTLCMNCQFIKRNVNGENGKNQRRIKIIKNRNERIISAHKRGFTMKEVARLFNISDGRVCQIIHSRLK